MAPARTSSGSSVDEASETRLTTSLLYLLFPVPSGLTYAACWHCLLVLLVDNPLFVDKQAVEPQEGRLSQGLRKCQKLGQSTTRSLTVIEASASQG